MSRLNFKALIDRFPDRGKVLKRLDEWFHVHPDKDVIDPRELVWAWRHDREIAVMDLAETLTVLVREGYLRQLYMVVSPSGALAGDPETGRGFESPVEVPTNLPDAFDRRFSTSESEIVPVFEEKGADERK